MINNTPPDSCYMFSSCVNDLKYNLRSSNNGNLFVPRPNSNFMKKTFHYTGTILWNFLPPSVKIINTIDTFKEKYAAVLMNKQENQ